MEKIKMTRKLLIILKTYKRLFDSVEGRYYKEIYNLEKMMEHETGIKGIGFFFVDNEFAGIGTPDEPEKMDLIHRNRLEK